MKNPYEDILHTKYPYPTERHKMTMQERAAQFSSFAALTGHEEAIQETARLTEEQMELSEEEKEKINRILQSINKKLQEKPPVKAHVLVTYFREDHRKSGGSYQTVTGTVKKLDSFEKLLLLDDGTKIPMESIALMEELK